MSPSECLLKTSGVDVGGDSSAKENEDKVEAHDSSTNNLINIYKEMRKAK